ncbi:hypothetical protein [Evansella tamaricis]|uniref:LlaJI restriction endonuclease n=1 Tax=Evansella tamaricis TaxID=2069301 RepID=A0ABS6JEA6_9BACI|nr:hypothetical protein [Evansella tamaricis]MBU9712003.1 hypothetical protein [Evansella tamaricis]
MSNMRYHIVQDGDFVDPLTKIKFINQLNDRDIAFNQDGERYNFVGIIFNSENVLISFPKNTLNLEQREAFEKNRNTLYKHMHLLFQCIKKTVDARNDRYAGIRRELNADYPFLEFFVIYQYYKKFGLFTNEKEIRKFGYTGKISWKDTINKSPTVVNNNNILFLPLVIKNNVNEHVFISKCMAFVIDSTLEKFSLILQGNKLNLDTSDIDFTNKPLIISQLRNTKRTMFKNVHQRLVDGLISFFEQRDNQGGNQHLKIYSFHLVWESMVGNYLRKKFKRVTENDELVFSDETMEHNPFMKKIVYPDVRGENGHRIEPDHYLISGNFRYIMDAKYYQAIKELDYKQISYYFLLKHFEAKRDSNGDVIEELKTYNALILPTAGKNDSEKHFEFNPEFNMNEERFVITIQYLNTLEVMRIYTNV